MNIDNCERSETIHICPGLDCFVAQPVVGPATSGRTRWLRPGYWPLDAGVQFCDIRACNTESCDRMPARKRTIEVDDATAAALETRAAEAGVSVAQLLAEIVACGSAAEELPPSEIAELDRQWSQIKAGEATTRHEDVVRWLDTWGTPRFRSSNPR